jgi:DNA-binding NtrC family response regulator
MDNRKILIIEDEPSLLDIYTTFLSAKGFEVDTAEDGGQAISKAQQQEYALVIVDLGLPVKGGMDVIQDIKSIWPDTDFIVCTGQCSFDSAIEAMRLDVFDYLCKPVVMESLIRSIGNALEKRRLKLDNKRLLAELQYERSSLENRVIASKKAVETHLKDSTIFIGESPAVRQIRQLIAEVAPSDMTILIRGESGTGKDVVANLIHEWSGRAATGKCIKINCPAISESLLESEMFGHERGAFTGAHRDKPGRVEFADDGTVFLDEIGTISLAFQAKLLQVIEQKTFVRVGGNKTLKVNARFIAATNAPLEAMINKGLFRPDLLYRLAQYTIFISPLRERREDIPLLINHYMHYYLAKYERTLQAIPHEIMDMLTAYDWPGNVRELQSVVNRVVLSGKFDILQELLNMAGSSVRPEKSKKIHDTEVKLILSILNETKWNRRRAAELLGISYSTLRRKIEKYEMDIGMKQFSDGEAQIDKPADMLRPGN